MAKYSIEKTRHTDAAADVGAHADDRSCCCQYAALPPWCREIKRQRGMIWSGEPCSLNSFTKSCQREFSLLGEKLRPSCHLSFLLVSSPGCTGCWWRRRGGCAPRTTCTARWCWWRPAVWPPPSSAGPPVEHRRRPRLLVWRSRQWWRACLKERNLFIFQRRVLWSSDWCCVFEQSKQLLVPGVGVGGCMLPVSNVHWITHNMYVTKVAGDQIPGITLEGKRLFHRQRDSQ